MKTEYAVALSVILGGLLGFGLSYAFLAAQISPIKASLSNLEEQFTSLSTDVQEVKTASQKNEEAVSKLNRTLNSRLSSLQNEVSDAETRLRSEIQEMKTSLLGDISSLQSRISELQEEWVFVGSWEGTSDFHTKENFKVEKKVLMMWWFEGSSYDSFAYIRIYNVKGEFIRGVGVSGYFSTSFVRSP